MDTQILDFLDKERIGCLTVLFEGFPHSASLHYSYNREQLEFYFSTDKTSRKCRGLLNGETVKGSCVVGFTEEEFKTVQMDGEVKIISDAQEVEKIQAVHYKKFPESEKWKGDPNTVYLKFVPTWWRYSDFKSKPPTFISSED